MVTGEECFLLYLYLICGSLTVYLGLFLCHGVVPYVLPHHLHPAEHRLLSQISPPTLDFSLNMQNINSYSFHMPCNCKYEFQNKRSKANLKRWSLYFQ